MQRIKHIFQRISGIVNTQQYSLANFLVRQYTKCAKHNKQRYRLLHTRELDMNWFSKPAVFRANHHINLFRRYALEVGHRFDFRDPIILCIVFRDIITRDAILCCSFLSQHGLFRPIDDEISTRIKSTLARLRTVEMLVLLQDAYIRL